MGRDIYDVIPRLKEATWEYLSEQEKQFFFEDLDANEPDCAVTSLLEQAIDHEIDGDLISDAYLAIDDEAILEFFDEHYDLGNRLRAEGKI